MAGRIKVVLRWNYRSLKWPRIKQVVSQVKPYQPLSLFSQPSWAGCWLVWSLYRIRDTIRHRLQICHPQNWFLLCGMQGCIKSEARIVFNKLFKLLRHLKVILPGLWLLWILVWEQQPINVQLDKTRILDVHGLYPCENETIAQQHEWFTLIICKCKNGLSYFIPPKMSFGIWWKNHDHSQKFVASNSRNGRHSSRLHQKVKRS